MSQPATQTTKQITWPTGMVMHMAEWVDGRPGIDLPMEAAPQRKRKILYPMDMVARGYIYVEAEAAKALKAGDAIQIDRTHTTIRRVGRPCAVKSFTVASEGETVLACRVELSDKRTHI